MQPRTDAGSSTDYAGPLADLDANDRAQDDPETPDTGLAFRSPGIDMGAFELQTDPADADFNNDGAVDGFDILDLLDLIDAATP